MTTATTAEGKCWYGLSDLFDQLNRVFFRGRLPRYRVHRTCAHSRYGLGMDGRCDPETQIIFIRKDLPGDKLRSVLLHEMCHIGSTGHGRCFQAKLKRLGAMGEAWATEEAQQYRSERARLKTGAAYLKDVIVYCASDNPDATWLQVRHHLCWLMALLPRELLRSYPWARRAWKREIAMARQLRANKSKTSLDVAPGSTISAQPLPDV